MPEDLPNHDDVSRDTRGAMQRLLEYLAAAYDFDLGDYKLPSVTRRQRAASVSSKVSQLSQS